MLNFSKTKKITVRNTCKKTIFLKNFYRNDFLRVTQFTAVLCKLVMKKCSYTIRNETTFYVFFNVIKFV